MLNVELNDFLAGQSSDVRGRHVTTLWKRLGSLAAGTVVSLILGAIPAQADTTLYYYDVFGRLIGQTSSAANITGYDYDNADNRTGILDTYTSAPTNSTMLQVNQLLLQNQQIVSSDGRYTLALQGDGNVVLYDYGSPIWAAGTANLQGAFLWLQSDGNLVLYGPQFNPIWASGTSSASNSNSTLTVQTDGNLVLRNSASVVTWQTHTNGQ